MSTSAQLDSWDALQPHINRQDSRTFGAIRSRQPNGATLQELADELHREMSSVSGSIRRLMEKGLVADSGRTRTNPRSGKQNTVWIETRGQRQLLNLKETKDQRIKRLETEMFKIKTAAANLANYAAAVRQDGSKNQPEWIVGLIDRIETMQGILQLS